jgi:predicted DCC family thiol-disulfide oxidoreductase YuxK
MSEHRPVMLYDGRCAFCGRWVQRWRHSIGEAIDYQPYQEAAARFPQIPPDAPGRAVHLIETDGRVTRGAAAIFRAMALADHRRWPWGLYEKFAAFAFVSEYLYSLVATHRTAADRIDRLLLGSGTEPTRYDLTRQIFLRSLAVVYAIAFLSLWVQIDGLVGSHGILPIHSMLQHAQSALGNDRFHLLPTLCWLKDSDGFLHLLCGVGVMAAVLAMAGIAQLPALVLMYVCYLSLSIAGQDFLEFQWDILLTEAGFLAIFFAPWQLWNRTTPPPSRTILWMLRWLLFRVMFMSGVVKLASGDPSWRSLTALQFHYQTQPLPTWIGWYAQQFPAWFQRFSCGGVFFFELAVPLLIFTLRRPRLAAFWLIVTFQLLIAVTGNYGFFNLLTIVLCMTLPDDAFWRWLLRRGPARGKRPTSRLRWSRFVTVPVGVALLALTVPEFIEAFGTDFAWPAPLMEFRSWAQPFRLANGYGLFAVMTTRRPELIVQGSDDGIEWKTYGFQWKPVDVHHRPAFVTAHMPRLDWQMWFAALGGPNDSPWLSWFLNSLLKGSPDVLALLGDNPFPDHPPHYVRVLLYEYRFTNSAERGASGAWWDRQEIGLFGQMSAGEQ